MTECNNLLGPYHVTLSYVDDSFDTLGEYCVILEVPPSILDSSNSKIIAVLMVLDMWHAQISSPHPCLFASTSHECRFALLLELHLNQPSKQ